jgi:hypothetical protein
MDRGSGHCHMNRVEFLRSQVERAKRFAAMLTNISDLPERTKIEIMDCSRIDGRLGKID